jgi:putative ABC transport system substrate-binding protein
MKRRAFMSAAGAAAAWPTLLLAQRRTPVVGFLSSRSPGESAGVVAAFREGLKQAGLTEGRNFALTFRWAEGRYDLLPALAADLTASHVDLIFAAGGAPSAIAAKAATTSIPIVFVVGDDPVQIGLAASLNHPGGNATGVTFVTTALAAKRLELMSELVPSAKTVALMVNTSNPNTVVHEADAQDGARSLGRQLVVLDATTSADIDARIAGLRQNGAAALVVQNDAFFDSQRERIVALTAQHRVPAVYHIREFPAIGGLASYGSNLPDVYRQCGVYAARILNGAKPPELPIEQTTRFEFVLNMKTAKALDLAVPPAIFERADEVIE